MFENFLQESFGGKKDIWLTPAALVLLLLWHRELESWGSDAKLEPMKSEPTDVPYCSLFPDHA